MLLCFNKLAKLFVNVYGVKCSTSIAANRANISTSTGFMISPGVLATVSHGVHVENNFSKAVHQNFEVICARDIGQKTELAQFIAEDTDKDIALLRVTSPRSTQSVVLAPDILGHRNKLRFLGFSAFFCKPAKRAILSSLTISRSIYFCI